MLINFYTKNVQSHLVFKRKWKIIFDFSETWAQLLNPSKDNLFWFWPERRHGEKQKLYHIKRKKCVNHSMKLDWNSNNATHTHTHVIYASMSVRHMCAQLEHLYRNTTNLWIFMPLLRLDDSLHSKHMDLGTYTNKLVSNPTEWCLYRFRCTQLSMRYDAMW